MTKPSTNILINQMNEEIKLYRTKDGCTYENGEVNQSCKNNIIPKE